MSEYSLWGQICARWLRCAVCAAGLWIGSQPVRGTEPVQAFLVALRDRKMYDEAIDYAQRLSDNKYLPESQRQKSLYEQGQVLLASAADQQSAADRATQLSRAAELLEKFVVAFPEHSAASSAEFQIIDILVQRGQIDARELGRAEAKPDSLTAARERFEEAKQRFGATEKRFDAALQKFPKFIGPEQSELKEQRDQLSGDLARLRLLGASIEYELATTWASGQLESKKHLQAAAQGFSAVHKSYRTGSAGLLARLWEGRCYQELGETKQAIGCFKELMDQPATQAEVRTIKTKATRHALECWSKEIEKRHPDMIERGEQWAKEIGARQSDADALAIQYYTGAACHTQSKVLPPQDPQRKKLEGAARQRLVFVADHPGDFQRPARVMLASLDPAKSIKRATSSSKTFAEALEKATQALAIMQEASAALKAPPKDADAKAMADYQQQKDDQTALALAELQSALRLADAKTPVADLNFARYYLCHLAWEAGEYYDAAVLGQYLAERFPDSVPGKRGARLALAAWVRIYSDIKDGDKAYEAARVEQMAELIFKQWPNDEEADEAALTMLSFVVANRQFDKVPVYLAKIPETSPRRGAAELRAGQSLWSGYLQASQATDGERPAQSKLDALKNSALEILTKGIERVEKANPADPSLPAALLTMAQIEVETGHPDKAITWLERPKIGPLAVAKASAGNSARNAFAIETYKMALRAYIAVTPQQMKKAQATMTALEKLVQASGDAKSVENLTAIYISLGREMQKHLEALRKAGRVQEIDAVAKAFEVFMDRITERKEGVSYATLNWVGETYSSLAGTMESGSPGLAAKAPEFYRKAAAAYQRMLELAEKDPKFRENPNGLIPARLRLADCYRRGGNMDEAIQTLVGVLKQKPNLLAVQVQAAEAYQAKGATDPAAYAAAIRGGDPGKDGKNVVWGWSKISIVTTPRPDNPNDENSASNKPANKADLEKTFHQARLKMAEARMQFALTQKDEAKRNNILEAAKQDLWYTYKVQPLLGGPTTTTEYDRLLKQIQKHLGGTENGLEEFKQRDAAGASAEAK